MKANYIDAIRCHWGFKGIITFFVQYLQDLHDVLENTTDKN